MGLALRARRQSEEQSHHHTAFIRTASTHHHAMNTRSRSRNLPGALELGGARHNRAPSGSEAAVSPRLWRSVFRSLTGYTGRGSRVSSSTVERRLSIFLFVLPGYLASCSKYTCEDLANCSVPDAQAPMSTASGTTSDVVSDTQSDVGPGPNVSPSTELPSHAASTPAGSNETPTEDTQSDLTGAGTAPATDACTPDESRSCSEGGAKGNCGRGTQRCGADGTFGACDVKPAERDECTPGDDADCDGIANGGCGCVDGTVRSCALAGMLGSCALGTQTCLADGGWGECSVLPKVGDDCALPGNDDDCDGTPSTGCDCTDGAESECAGNSLGICNPGTTTCVDGKYGTCEGVVAPAARDCSSSQDNDCDGMPDNTLDGVCQCQPGETRACDTHPGFDGKGRCQAGSQTCVLSADGSTSYFEPSCTGAVGPALRDSCDIPLDDSNCSGTPNDGCSCTTANAATACNDNKACTTDSCSGGQCQNTVQSGSCLIAGVCYSNGAVNPSNPCHHCDTSKSTTSWSNFPSGQSCDDGLWCNGDNDTCDGNGVCSHQFANGNRCASTSGACALTTCSESNRTCFQPNTFVCATNTVTGCIADGCSSDVMSWPVDSYCKGDRADCSGGQTVARQNAATLSRNCSASQECSNAQCVAALECSSTVFCDSGSGLCWMNADSSTDINQDDAKVYCNNLTLEGNSNWRLPTRSEFSTITRGCASGPCPVAQGPGQGGCYWPIEMGRCDHQLWTSDAAFAWIVEEGVMTMTIPSLTNYRARCVADGP